MLTRISQDRFFKPIPLLFLSFSLFISSPLASYRILPLHIGEVLLCYPETTGPGRSGVR